jgi:hypothetical protein
VLEKTVVKVRAFVHEPFSILLNSFLHNEPKAYKGLLPPLPTWLSAIAGNQVKCHEVTAFE